MAPDQGRRMRETMMRSSPSTTPSMVMSPYTPSSRLSSIPPNLTGAFVDMDKVLFVETSFGWFLGFVASDSLGLHTMFIPGGNTRDGSIPSVRPTLHQSFLMPLRRRSQAPSLRKIACVSRSGPYAMTWVTDPLGLCIFCLCIINEWKVNFVLLQPHV